MFEDSEGSDWNEQQAFSLLFFQATRNCRNAQLQGDLHAWVKALFPKFSVAIGILPKEINRIKGWRKDIKLAKSEYNHAINIKNQMSINNSKEKLDELLYDIESHLDILVNKKMPFLKEKEVFDPNLI